MLRILIVPASKEDGGFFLKHDVGARGWYGCYYAGKQGGRSTLFQTKLRGVQKKEKQSLGEREILEKKRQKKNGESKFYP